MNCFEILSLVTTILVHYISATTVPTTCNQYQFQCEDGECIAMVNLCDGRRNCNDGSDETKCRSENYPKCKSGYFQCVSDRRCIPSEYRCDDDEDCDDDSDEANCHASLCIEDYEFSCTTNSQCIEKEMRCDGNFDCRDGSDEHNCDEITNRCLDGSFFCEDKSSCVPQEWLCDNEDDCRDGSDEKHCDKNFSPSTTPHAEQSCPDNYCLQNAVCFVFEGQYYCNCPPSFTGEKCEMSIAAERSFNDMGMVIGIAMTLITLFIITGLVLFCYCKRRTARNSTALLSKTESQTPVASYSTK